MKKRQHSILFILILMMPWEGTISGADRVVEKPVITHSVLYTVNTSRNAICAQNGLIVDMSHVLRGAYLQFGYFGEWLDRSNYFTAEYYTSRPKPSKWVCDSGVILGRRKISLLTVDDFPPHWGNIFCLPLNSGINATKYFKAGEPTIDIEAVTPRALDDTIAIVYRYVWAGDTHLRKVDVKTEKVLSDIQITPSQLIDVDALDWISNDILLGRRTSRLSIGYVVIDANSGNELTSANNILIRKSRAGIIARAIDNGDENKQKVKEFLFFDYKM